MALSLAFVGDASAKMAPLPGATLGGQTQDGSQPVSNPENVLADETTPSCPYDDTDLRSAMNYARANDPAVYRQARVMRRTGATKEATLEFLNGNITCP